LVCSLSIAVCSVTEGGNGQTTFSSAQEAVEALSSAVKAQEPATLRALFGPALKEIANPDRVQATNEFAAFAAALDESVRLVRKSETNYIIEVGANSWPFPIPIVERGGVWLFDSAAGVEELLNRRIGQNELQALEVMRACVDAQREYAGRDRDGDEVLEYAQKLESSEGQTDGLHWPPELNGEVSPLGPLVAEAQGVGYLKNSANPEAGPRPFHGYYFRLLTGQGKNAPGGKYNYIINGNMIGGFALVAWPAEYGRSGVMTFIVNQQGRVYHRDLSAGTAKIASKMRAYDPDPSWRISPD
jgi:hypothetical protein